MRLPAILPLPLTPRQTRTMVLLLGVMLLSAATEGFGLLLLVPMLAVLAGASAQSGKIVDLLELAGIPVAVAPLLTIFVVLVLLRALINYGRTILGVRFEISIVDGLRSRAWRALIHCNWRRLSEMRQSDSASLLITNIDRIGVGLGEALRALATAVTLGGLGLAALAISPRLAIAALAVGIAVLIAFGGMRRRAAALGERLTVAYKAVYAQTGEALGALRVIKSFGKEERAEQASDAVIADMRAAQLAYVRDAGFVQIMLQAGGALLLAVLVWLAIERWQAGIAEILPLVALFARALPLVGALQRSWQEWAHARPAMDETLRLIEVAEAAREPAAKGAIAAPGLADELRLESVSVSFSGRSVAALDGVTLSFPAKSVTAIAGPSGSGKSTLADVVGGLIAADEGRVTVDGVILEGSLLRAWRERVTYVQQEPVLFTGSIRENLLWADPEASEACLAEVLGQASASFVLELPDGLDTRIGESGRQLSGGERQRLVLARALLRDPSLLILDEASSALDAENEAAIAGAVANLRGRMTIIVIGHRGALGELADRCVRLEAGRIVPLESGKL